MLPCHCSGICGRSRLRTPATKDKHAPVLLSSYYPWTSLNCLFTHIPRRSHLRHAPRHRSSSTSTHFTPLPLLLNCQPLSVLNNRCGDLPIPHCSIHSHRYPLTSPVTSCTATPHSAVVLLLDLLPRRTWTAIPTGAFFWGRTTYFVLRRGLAVGRGRRRSGRSPSTSSMVPRALPTTHTAHAHTPHTHARYPHYANTHALRLLLRYGIPALLRRTSYVSDVPQDCAISPPGSPPLFPTFLGPPPPRHFCRLRAALPRCWQFISWRVSCWT